MSEIQALITELKETRQSDNEKFNGLIKKQEKTRQSDNEKFNKLIEKQEETRQSDNEKFNKLIEKQSQNQNNLQESIDKSNEHNERLEFLMSAGGGILTLSGFSLATFGDSFTKKLYIEEQEVCDENTKNECLILDYINFNFHLFIGFTGALFFLLIYYILIKIDKLFSNKDD